MLVECPIGIVILVVPHVEDTKEARYRDNGALGILGGWELKLGKLCLGDLRGDNQRHRLRRAEKTTNEVAQLTIDN